ncbi:hypothetical protein AJ80_08195 [Polytolypa hystricis UAMH7299]|uniref:Uncharacterized protein n=1 Tax=Polytolypa hystricis (strain UAMH7299) TaxID=1447883 RepID=A0A2B7XAV0_POLH7|nr:hypothetical protein AJ80_08195 [Polytolypa hystricis UAMH7299]
MPTLGLSSRQRWRGGVTGQSPYQHGRNPGPFNAFNQGPGFASSDNLHRQQLRRGTNETTTCCGTHVQRGVPHAHEHIHCRERSGCMAGVSSNRIPLVRSGRPMPRAGVHPAFSSPWQQDPLQRTTPSYNSLRRTSLPNPPRRGSSARPRVPFSRSVPPFLNDLDEDDGYYEYGRPRRRRYRRGLFDDDEDRSFWDDDDDLDPFDDFNTFDGDDDDDLDSVDTFGVGRRGRRRGRGYDSYYRDSSRTPRWGRDSYF